MSRVRNALLVALLASSVWMFAALLLGLFADDHDLLDEGGRSAIAWTGVGVLAAMFLIALLIANAMHHSSERRQDRREIKALTKRTGRGGTAPRPVNERPVAADRVETVSEERVVDPTQAPRRGEGLR